MSFLSKLLTLFSIIAVTILFFDIKTGEPQNYKPIISEKSSVIENTDEQNNNIILSGTSVNITYYNQTNPLWADKFYGADDTIAVYGCGPTVLAMLVSSLTDTVITPDDMAAWCYDNGYFCENSGSYHSIISQGAAKWGLNVTPLNEYSNENITTLLSTGNLIVVLVGKGHFTESGHFIILRGVSLEGNYLIADPKSFENSNTEWLPDIIIQEAKYGCGYNGPMWIITPNFN